MGYTGKIFKNLIKRNKKKTEIVEIMKQMNYVNS